MYFTSSTFLSNTDNVLMSRTPRENFHFKIWKMILKSVIVKQILQNLYSRAKGITN